MTGGVDRGEFAEFDCGGVTVRPRERMIESKHASVAVEPLVMQLLLMLSARAGHLVTRREIFDRCWGNSAVGDDSLNRIVAALRKALQQVAKDILKIETVPGTGYVMRLPIDLSGTGLLDPDTETRGAIEAAFDSWRFAYPAPDYLCLARMRRACVLQPAYADAWGMLALLCRHAAEYGDGGSVSEFVTECERSARRAIELDPLQPEARTALLSVVPLFGHWGEAREGLRAIIEVHPENAVALQDLATLEMATGRVRESKALRDALAARDPLGACSAYKRVYQHWSVGDLAGMDHLAEQGLSLWPTHPAVWNVRLWTFAYTGRVPAALSMLESNAVKPHVPPITLQFLRTVFSAVAEQDPRCVDHAIEMSMQAATSGPANAIASLFALGLLDQADHAFEVVEAYYLRGGAGPVPSRHTDAEMSLNEQHRRLTQVLFTPVFANMRADPRFKSACDRIGLTRYWDENGVTPDFLASH